MSQIEIKGYPIRILLVEDDDRITDPLAEDLRHQSHAVDVAHDGMAGWEFVRAATYSLPARKSWNKAMDTDYVRSIVLLYAIA